MSLHMQNEIIKRSVKIPNQSPNICSHFTALKDMNRLLTDVATCTMSAG